MELMQQIKNTGKILIDENKKKKIEMKKKNPNWLCGTYIYVRQTPKKKKLIDSILIESHRK